VGLIFIIITAFHGACANGHLSLCQWLYNLGDINIHIRKETAFGLACSEGHLPVAKWLVSCEPVEQFNFERVDYLVISHQDIEDWLYESAKRLYEAFTLAHQENFSSAFEDACESGHLESAEVMMIKRLFIYVSVISK
jgi:hypothetical protein